MATFEGHFRSAGESFVGTDSNDFFIIGDGNEVALGGHGIDTAQLPKKLADYSSAILFPHEGIVALKQVLYAYFLDGIEIVEFADQVVNITDHVHEYMLREGKSDELIPFTELKFGQLRSQVETLSSDTDTLFAPGPGDANIIGAENRYSAVVIPSNIKSNITSIGARATIEAEEILM